MSTVGRDDWESHYIKIAILASTRSTCSRRKVGAIAVRNKRIIATGYNGAPENAEHCETNGCIRQLQNIPSGERLDICRAVHAEQNLIIQAAMMQVSLCGSIIYCTHQPCFTCAKLLINIRPNAIYYLHPYPDQNSLDMMAQVRIPFLKLNIDPEEIQWP